MNVAICLRKNWNYSWCDFKIANSDIALHAMHCPIHERHWFSRIFIWLHTYIHMYIQIFKYWAFKSQTSRLSVHRTNFNFIFVNRRIVQADKFTYGSNMAVILWSMLQIQLNFQRKIIMLIGLIWNGCL